MGKIFMGYWDCPYCGTKKNMGDVRNCPNCGKPRGDDVKFYMDSTSEEVKGADSINKNPDWLCSYCGSINSDSQVTCPSCGHFRDESDANYFENQKKREKKYNGTPTYKEQQLPVKQASAAPRKNKRWIIMAAIAAMLLLLAAVFIPKTKTITIESLPWERTVAIEEYRTVQESSWDLPDGAWNVSERNEIRSYSQVLDHYETKTRQVSEQVFDGYDTSYSYRDLGNGMFEQIENRTPRYRTEYHTETYEDPVYISVPVYDTKYYYSIERWVYDHDEVAKGDDGRAYFPEYTFRDGITRDGGRTERYWIVDTNGKKYPVEYELWSNLTIGQTVKVKLSLGKIKSVK